MKIRAITIFLDIQPNDTETSLARAATFAHAAVYAFQQARITVQSRRVATQPFPRMGIPQGPVGIPELAARLREECNNYGIDYIGLGPVCADDDPAYADAIPDIFRSAPDVFACINIADPLRGIDLGLLRRTSRIIREVSTIRADGLANLYLAAIANCGPGAPFFPVAYHRGSGPARFALAIESADLAIHAFDGAESPAEARQQLTHLIDDSARQLCAVAEQLAVEHGIVFDGLDFSLAPYPGEGSSLGSAMEHLGVRAGGAGMVGAAALVMNAIEAATFPRCGFSGLMLPVLEDTILGQRAAEGTLQINDLLLYSAICGTGLDCIPLPGDISDESLAAILLDVAALALRLDKPLTARLMPLPGKAAGDPVVFPSFEYFVPSRVMPAPTGFSAGSNGAFCHNTVFEVIPRRL
jgi:uncharacterized protein (UPF0210 family)